MEQNYHFRLTIRQSFYNKGLAGWSMSNFVKSIYFNLVFRQYNKIENNNLRHVPCSIHFFIQQRAKASVSYSIAQQLFFVAGWRQAIPGHVNGSGIERITSYERRSHFRDCWEKGIQKIVYFKTFYFELRSKHSRQLWKPGNALG